jgi:psiF repeat
VPKKSTTPEGIQCSAEADAKGLKGKERKSFRGKCMAAAKKAAQAAAAPKSVVAPGAAPVAPAAKKN